MHIFTTGAIQNTPEVQERIKPIFDRVFSAEEHNLNKKQPEAYTFIARQLGKDPNEIFYIDDQLENVFAAKEAGIDALLFDETQDPIRQIRASFL